MIGARKVKTAPPEGDAAFRVVSEYDWNEGMFTIGEVVGELDESAVQGALLHFGITPIELKLVSRQPDRAVWQVTTARDQYALKCTKSPKKAPTIGAASHYLHHRGVPVIKAIPTIIGDLFVTVSKFCFMLFPWVVGVRPIYEDHRMIRPMATLLAQFHEASSGFVGRGAPVEDRLKKGPRDLSRHLDELRKEVTRHDDAFTRVLRMYLPWLQTRVSWVASQPARSDDHKTLILEARRSPLLTHGDYSAVNLLADEKGDLTIIDLDEVAVSLPVWEISQFISWMNHDSIGWSGERFLSVLDAYRQVRPISAFEEELIRMDQVRPHQAVSLAREYYQGSSDTDVIERFERCIATDIDMLRYLEITL